MLVDNFEAVNAVVLAASLADFENVVGDARPSRFRFSVPGEALLRRVSTPPPSECDMASRSSSGTLRGLHGRTRDRIGVMPEGGLERRCQGRMLEGPRGYHASSKYKKGNRAVELPPPPCSSVR